ncbi:histidinol-phosphate transaminase [Thiohalomonas denitrificans]|nr:histidinol-phosphate transaminase [Thiohalomonas denitrificans]
MKKELIDKWIRPEIRAINAYPVPDPGRLIKLDAMENPYTLPPELLEEWLDALRDVPLNRYPDAKARHLTDRLRATMDVPAGMDLLLGNGSDEIIQMLALALGGPGRTVLAPEPGFVMYRMIATFTGMDYVGVPLQEEDFGLNRDAMLKGIDQHQPAIVYLAYPNNPTGNLFDPEDMVAIIEAAPGLVVVDEAYHAFAEQSFMGRLGEWDNLLVMRTVSKLGLAGLRLGFLAGPREWIGELDKVRLPYNINVLTQVSGEFALSHMGVLDEQTARIREERGRLASALGGIEGVTPCPSAANFILFRVADDADAVFAGLQARGVLIKNLNPAGGALSGCLRVTVGTPEENEAFLAALRESLG